MASAKTTSAKKMRKKTETPPPAVATPQQTEAQTVTFSLADEAAKLLEVGARIDNYLSVLQMAGQTANPDPGAMGNSPRQHAAKLRIRMNKFSSIYNAAWMVRHYQRTSGKGLEKAINDFCVALARELERAADKEALLYAVAESLTISPYGVPWES